MYFHIQLALQFKSSWYIYNLCAEISAKRELGEGGGGDLVFKDRSKIEVNCTIVCISGDYMIKANLVN